MKLKLVALDMDGTLLDSQKRLPPDFIPWVENHPDIKTIIASGRQYHTLIKDFIVMKCQKKKFSGVLNELNQSKI